MPKLIIRLQDDPKAREVEVRDAEVTIGKSPERNTVVVPDSRVSREHARIFRVGPDHAIEDRGSKNGTILDGRAIPPRVPQRLRPGSVISLAGACTITFVAPAGEGESGVEFVDQPVGDAVILRSPGDVEPPRGMGGPEMTTAPPHALIEDLVRLQSTVERQAKRLRLLYKLGKSLSSEFSPDEIFRQAADVLFAVTPADRCCVLLRKDGSSSLVPALVGTRDGKGLAAGETLLISQSVVRRVLEDRISLASFSTRSDERLRGVTSILEKGIQSVMCAPLLGRQGVLGAVYADRQSLTDAFNSEDLELLDAIAGAASTALDGALSHDRLSREALARAAYGRFVPQHVVEQILAAPEALHPGGSNQTATILFADLRGFTRMAESLRPEEVVRILNAYFQAAAEIVFAFGGTLDKFIGDGLMALFGAPYPTADDAANAALAAVAIEQRMLELASELGIPPLGIGIGINTGEVTVGYIGSDRRLDYTAIGDAVNLAARLEQTAARGQIRVTEATRALLGDRFRLAPLGSIHLKGREKPVSVFEVLWEPRRQGPVSGTG